MVLNKADGDIYMQVCLLLIEIFAPLTSMFAEEHIVLGSFDILEFFKNNKDFFIAPVFAIHAAYGLKKYYQTMAVSASDTNNCS